MLIAAVHATPWVTVPAAVAAAAFLIWFWRRVGRIAATRAPRRIRRLSILIMLLSLPNFVRGLSFLDSGLHPGEYLVSWSISLLLVLIVLLTACVDAMWTMRLYTRRLQKEMSFAAGALIEAARRDGGADGPDASPASLASPGGVPEDSEDRSS